MSGSSHFIPCRFLILFTLLTISVANNTITPSQAIEDGQTLVSAGGCFVLGFFSPGDSKNRYVGIWFAVSNQAVVWVANRDNPLNDFSGVLKVDAPGNLVLTNKASEVIWSSGLPAGGNTIAQLMDSGNLVLRSGSSGNTGVFLWQSFDYPCDTLLAGMKLGPDLGRRLERSLTAWRSADDPARGDYTFKLDPRGLPQPFLLDKQLITYRGGPWIGPRFSGTPEMKHYDMFNFTVVRNQEETYYEFGITKPSIIARLVLNWSGLLQRLVWDAETATWNPFWSGPKEQCDYYGVCGPNGLCDMNRLPVCDCLHGFQPKNPEEWYLRNWNGGCVRKTSLNCSDADGFVVVQQVKLPNAVKSMVDMSIGLDECRDLCLKNCPCTAYSTANISGQGSGCVMWIGDLVDMRAYTADGQDLYLRLAASELDSTRHNFARKKRVAIITTATVLLGLLLLAFRGCCIWRKRKMTPTTIEDATRMQHVNRNPGEENPELPLFDFDTIASATNDFSIENTVGKGGFGIVYKGTLVDGQEVAVKRLSLHSWQGVDEFMNEVMLIAKLRHRNLVTLLGCCIKGEERMLIYEYMPNKSLDDFIFADKQKRALLDWRKRLDIILGVARGLLYLHQDSPLRIIHRDLKAGNILLDGDMNPKISDFGTARIFGRDQMEGNTVKIVGTIGYMSPEYAIGGKFSEKSDVFSFGVLVLEIISGRKNRGISHNDSKLNLLSHVWRLWTEEHCLELLGDTLQSPCPFPEVLRFVQVGLLCVQESPKDRPTMQQVVLMLVNEHWSLPPPKEPGFYNPTNAAVADWSSRGQESSTINEITVTYLDGR